MVWLRVIPESRFVGFFQGFNGAFTKPPYCGSGPCYAEINAIQAVNIALSMGWQFVWLKRDSNLLTLAYLQNSLFHLPGQLVLCGWTVYNRSVICSFVVILILKGNSVADCLGKAGSNWFEALGELFFSYVKQHQFPKEY